MLPYIHVPDMKVGPITLHPFGVLVALGVIIGTWLATRRARQRGVDLDKLNAFITWMLILGFMGGHMLDEIAYHPDELKARWYSLFLLWEGLSSFGGFIGGLIGVLLFKFVDAKPWLNLGIVTIPKFKLREKPMPILPFCDIILSVYPVAWVFGRSGCATVHDHPGARVESLLAVGYPLVRPPPDAPFALIQGPVHRFDLGLLEMMFTVIIAICFALTWNKRLRTGTYVAVVSLVYAPVRFVMDYFRITDGADADPRYGSLTPAQWACVALFVFGIVMIGVIRRNAARGIDPMQDILLAREGTPPESAEAQPAPA